MAQTLRRVVVGLPLKLNLFRTGKFSILIFVLGHLTLALNAFSTLYAPFAWWGLVLAAVFFSIEYFRRRPYALEGVLFSCQRLLLHTFFMVAAFFAGLDAPAEERVFFYLPLVLILVPLSLYDMVSFLRGRVGLRPFFALFQILKGRFKRT